MPSLEKSIEFMRVACDIWSLGYDQSQRWNIYDGGECDCSSLVITALKKGGFDTGYASYTGDMSYNLTRRGWKRLPANLSTARPGDVLLNDAYHTCMVISGKGWDSRIAQASIDENGNIVGGKAGDQSGRETNTRGIYTYSKGWNCILRYTAAPEPAPAPSGKLDVDGILGRLSITEWQTQLGTEADGIVSGQTLINRQYLSALTSVMWGGEGSLVVMAMQRRIIRDGISVGAEGADGYLGQGTVTGLQKWLRAKGYAIDSKETSKRILGPSTAKAVQRSLNDGKWR